MWSNVNTAAVWENLFTISSYLFGSTSTNGRHWEICISKNYQKRNTVETVKNIKVHLQRQVNKNAMLFCCHWCADMD